MPETRVLVFRSRNGKIPIHDGLARLKKKNKRAYAKCLDRIQRLARDGRDLRRPLADSLEEGIFELRARTGTEQHRILYFFHGEDVVVLSQLIQKEEVPASEISRAVEHKELVASDPDLHTAQWNG